MSFPFIDSAHERQRVCGWVYGVSPFAHVPKILMGEPVVVAPLLALLVLAALLMVVGLAGIARRDLG